MDITYFVSQLFTFALVFSCLAAIAEIAATRQVVAETYRHVPLIRLLRKGHKVAAGLIAAVGGCALWAAPDVYWPMVAITVTVGCLIQLQAMVTGYQWGDVVLFGVMPAAAVLIPLFSFTSSYVLGHVVLQLGAPALVVGVLIAANCVVIRHYRNHRDLLLVLQG